MPADHAPSMSRPRAAAGALIRNRHSDILLVKPTYKNLWDIPGGYIEPNETPTQACRREITEELGLDITPGSLLACDWAPSDAEGDKILFVFDGGQLTDDEFQAIHLQRSELAAAEFVPLTDITHRLPTRLQRRLTVAAQTTTTMYLEHGNPVPAHLSPYRKFLT
ncbi:NUDIX domain-containing protein [Haloglycomyces albus]|uniref:NUDIX domain-containing protein n=1 Tax=Haloglycomyces albus TaxID=526067 RepID=UPI00046D860D|nr:NUDIX hydrolase [Haloglycomyces albus]